MHKEKECFGMGMNVALKRIMQSLYLQAMSFGHPVIQCLYIPFTYIHTHSVYLCRVQDVFSCCVTIYKQVVLTNQVTE